MVQVQLFLLLIFFQGCFSQDVCQTGEGNIIICNILSGIQESINDLGPFEISELPLNFTSESFKGYLQLNNVNLTGLVFIPTEAELDLKLKNANAIIGLNFPSILLQAAYIVDLKIMDMIHLYGGGDLNVNIADLSLSAKVDINLITQKINQLKIIFKFPTVKVVITGLFDDPFMSSIISRQLSKTVTTILNEQEQALNNLIETIIDEYLNSVLEKLFIKY